ncbi:hypothetical protein cypCar_00038912 [Cyprinus carpio]|nr:hypothetical protein cypCar_00038912 [Cyprinus carpio]
MNQTNQLRDVGGSSFSAGHCLHGQPAGDLVILWKSVQKSLMANQEAFEYTMSKFSSVLPQYLKNFQEERCKAPLILLASLLPASAVPALRSKVMSHLRSLRAGTAVTSYTDAFIVELKEIALSVRRQTQSHYNITAENTDNIQRTIYESTVRMLNDILNPCQQPNS